MKQRTQQIEARIADERRAVADSKYMASHGEKNRERASQVDANYSRKGTLGQDVVPSQRAKMQALK